MVAQCAVAFSITGLPVIGPELQRHFGLTLVQTGAIFGATSFGAVLTVAAWGMAADHWGERAVLAVGMAGGALALAALVAARGYLPVLGLCALAGALTATASVGSGRALMGWFGPDELGLALGCRQMAVPAGGALAALVLPPVLAAAGTTGVFLLFAAVCAVPAITVLVALGPPPPARAGAAAAAGAGRSPLTDPRLWRLGASAALVASGQVSMVAYLVLFLNGQHGVPLQAAALALLAVQGGGAISRVVTGRVSDRLRSRIRPLRWVAAGAAVLFAVVALLLRSPVAVLVPLIVIATVTGMNVNGLGYTAAAELGGPGRAGAALGFQNTAMYLDGALAPVVFGAAVTLAGWPAGFALVAVAAATGWLLARPLLAAERGGWARLAPVGRGGTGVARAGGNSDT
jgi:sugar phosphate permease